MVQGVNGLDVVQDDLVAWVYVCVAVQIVGAVQKASRMMPEMGGKGLSECCAVAWCQALCLNAPQCYWLDAPFVQAKSDFQGRYLQCPQFELSLLGLLESLTQDWDSPSTGRLMIHSKVPHHSGDRWFVLLE